MHPDLLNNSLFLRYYQQWQENPESIVFASIADFFLRYQLLDDAFRVCREGLKHHPHLVSGHLVMARIHLVRGNWEEAEEEVQAILAAQPRHLTALALRRNIEEAKGKEKEEFGKGIDLFHDRLVMADNTATAVEERVPHGWRTVTMARIFTAQGHHQKAKDIYESILKGDPANEAAQKELAELRHFG